MSDAAIALKLTTLEFCFERISLDASRTVRESALAKPLLCSQADNGGRATLRRRTCSSERRRAPVFQRFLCRAPSGAQSVLKSDAGEA
jgi:hypothetical protein